MDGQMIAGLMFPAMFLLIFLGLPVSFALISVGFAGALVIFGSVTPLQLFGRVVDVTSSYALASIPPFIFMGAMLERAGLAEKLFQAIQLWVGRLPGGLALATILMGAIFAATTGIVGAVEAIIGMMAIPAMMKYGYKNDLTAGTICAGGSLGTIIPPSVLAVVYASVGRLPVGDVLAGIAIPGMLMVVLFVTYILGRCLIFPRHGPPVSREELDFSLVEKLRITAVALVPAALLIAAVLGSILWGIASPTEAAGVGALGATLLAFAYRTFSWSMFVEVLRQTVMINSMILMIVLGGTIFSSVFLIHGGADLVRNMIEALALGPAGMVVFFLLIVFVLGFVLDWVSIVLIVLPIFDALIRAAGIEPLWFGVMMIVVIQTSYLTPPMAPAIFYLRAVAPPEITYNQMFVGVIPYVVCQLITLAVVALMPWTATYLASTMKGF